MPPKLTPEIVRAAIDGFENQKKQIDAQIAELRGLLDGNAPATGISPEATPRKRRKFSADALRRMREAQQRRWAKVRGETEPTPTSTPAPKRTRRMSKEGRARIVAATKARWAKVRAEKAQQEKVAKKSAGKTSAGKTTAKKTKRSALKKSAPAAAPAGAQTA